MIGLKLDKAPIAFTFLCQNDQCWQNPDESGRGALYNYVFCEDETYSWQLIETYTLPGYTCYIINMTSQTWYEGK